MADNEENQAEAIIGSSKPQVKSGASSKGSIVWLGVVVGVVGICAAAGFYLGNMLKTANASQPDNQAAAAAPTVVTSGDPDADFHYLDIEQITVNLDEPRLTRFVRATITLAFDPKNEVEIQTQVKKRMPELKNWLAVYLAGRTLDEVRGAQSLNRVRREICEAFNEQIWPQQPPRIHHVLFKEFAVQ